MTRRALPSSSRQPRALSGRHLMASVATGLALGAGMPAVAGEIDVMTQNQYLGADLGPVLSAATAVPFDPQAFSDAVVVALKGISATRPAERAKALAALIHERSPDVAALQEVYRFRCDPYPGVPAVPGMGCNDPMIKDAFTDHLTDTLEALQGRFRSIGQVTNLQVAGLPFIVNGMPALLTVVDRDAILVRRDLVATAVDFSAYACRRSDQGCNYWTAPPPFTTPLGQLAIERGFLAADVTVKGASYRIFNTHLEQRLLGPGLDSTRLLQVGQASELLNFAINTWDGAKKVIVTGDFNSAPADPPITFPALAPTPYQIFAGNSFTDAWLRRPQAAEPGYSCCQLEALDNRAPQYYERIDLIFSLPPPRQVLDMRLLGNRMGDKLRPPGAAGATWPSDHASVAAKLQFD